MSKRALQLEQAIEKAQRFVKGIEDGNLSMELDGQVSESDGLMLSLISMRDKMREIAEQERKRNWTTEGLAKFVEILRNKNDNLNDLGESIIVNIVKYLGANQGALYFINNDGEQPVLDLIGCYAYNRKKYRSHQIPIGEGLAGQAVLEKDIIYMTDLPQNYLRITSGLGEALPRNLLILPLLLNDQAYGVIELASFSVFESHHREFLKKLGESIASTISNVRVNQQTRKLLEETQAQTELMRAQEEEMRQNMEELTATQEEMSRIVNEAQAKEGYVKSFMDACDTLILTVDRNCDVAQWNDAFQKAIAKSSVGSLSKGFALRAVLTRSYDEVWSSVEAAFAGETVVRNEFQLREVFTPVDEIRFAPIRNFNGDVIEVAISIRLRKESLRQAVDMHEMTHSLTF